MGFWTESCFGRELDKRSPHSLRHKQSLKDPLPLGAKVSFLDIFDVIKYGRENRILGRIMFWAGA